MTMVGRPPRRRPWLVDWEKKWAAARPSFRAVSAVTGSMFARPRTPSVPKIRFVMAISIPATTEWRRGEQFLHNDGRWRDGINLHAVRRKDPHPGSRRAGRRGAAGADNRQEIRR